MFDVERFTQECLEANAEADAHKAVLDLVERTCLGPGRGARRARRADMRGGDQALHSDDLTILTSCGVRT